MSASTTQGYFSKLNHIVGCYTNSWHASIVTTMIHDWCELAHDYAVGSSNFWIMLHNSGKVNVDDIDILSTILTDYDYVWSTLAWHALVPRYAFIERRRKSFKKKGENAIKFNPNGEIHYIDTVSYCSTNLHTFA